MNRIFFRFFVLVMLSITVATFVIYFAMSRLFGDPLDDIARRQAAAQIFLIEQYVDRAPTDEWLVRLNKVREVSDINIDLIPLAQARKALHPQLHEALERGDVVLDVARKAFYRRVDLYGNHYVGSADDVIWAQDLPIDIGLALKMEAVRYVIVALALLIPIALWSRTHWTGLQQLSRVADEVGAGQLSARAHMPPSASIYPLAERINHMAGRIESLLGAQRNLIHSVSHELRTPIARLEFALELLRSASDDPALEQRIAAMEGDVAELNGLVNELLNMIKLDSGTALQLSTVPLRALLQGCVDALPPSACALQVDLQAADATVQADPRLLARAIGNLLRNAQKYCEGQIGLSARAGSTVQIMVDDNGPGIPADQHARVFEPFYRLDRSRDRATGGFGLGLSIAHKAVALHGGTIRIEASPLGGARFVISLPARADRPAS
ncbi:two-component sensor histidine kinase [Massilia sp. PAMC28688]|uniref:ATP-binding protein n=1 Tax=Massilia sp. PAMC28688 TaxID=2861283 RepID=UPI001C63A962|nr:ATP-binding protein [Massilia sp. PAMC28688]QYF94038.1 two-component sensor histidine kinase [Massilia sp. PAMC28688]